MSLKDNDARLTFYRPWNTVEKKKGQKRTNEDDERRLFAFCEILVDAQFTCFSVNQSPSFLIESRERGIGQKRVLVAVRYASKCLPSSCERAAPALCSIRAPARAAASDIARLRPNCFCCLAVCAATRPEPSPVFPASIKSVMRVI